MLKDNLQLRKDIRDKLKSEGINIHYRQNKQLNRLTFYNRDFRWEFLTLTKRVIISTYDKPFSIQIEEYVKDTISEEKREIG